tara:strand:- start:2356 stop:3597 length:1242 start_codon:yes stop_codon:yes gene_type:complete
LKTSYKQKIFNIKSSIFKSTEKLKKINDELFSKIDCDYLRCLNIVRDNRQIQIIKKSSSIFNNCKFIVIIGTGGSSLGGKMLVSALGNSNKKLFFAENVDPDTIQELLSQIDLNHTGFIIISKSGETIETLCIYFYFLNTIKLRNIKIYEKTLVITERKPSTLKKIQEEENYHFLEHDKNIGGRYSVFSAVGLIPAQIAGINIKKFCDGGKTVLNQILNAKKPEATAPIKSALVKINLMKKGYNQSVLMTYSDKLKNFSDWYIQLWSESIGKNKKGSTAISSRGTVDQHSQLQLFLDGPNDKFITILGFEKPPRSIKLKCKISKNNIFESLNNKSMGDLFFAEKKATSKSLIRQKIPLRLIDLSPMNEDLLGKLVMSFFLETIYSCKLLNVNPFDQPAVEEGKVLALKFLKNA